MLRLCTALGLSAHRKNPRSMGEGDGGVRRLHSRRDRGEHGQRGLGTVLHHCGSNRRSGGPELFGNQHIRLAADCWYHLAVTAKDGSLYTMRQRPML